MKILLIHNKYVKHSGEESVVESQIELLRKKGHLVRTYFRHSKELESMKNGRTRAFLSGIHNPKSVKEINRIIDDFRPEIVHIHNLYPLISPSILDVIKKRGIPIVMTVHNYRLMCPSGLFFTKGEICEKCTSGIMEFNCVINNCENSVSKSIGYAFRNFWFRINDSYKNNVNIFLCLTNFQRDKLISNGFPEDRCSVLSNFYGKDKSEIKYKASSRKYIAFAGRISPEKGLPFLLEAASNLPDVEFRIAGEGELEYVQKLNVPKNVRMLGMLNADELKDFYNGAKFLVLTSRWYEGFPMVIPEAMAHRLPIIAPKMASFPEIVIENINGLLFDPNDIGSLIASISNLWRDSDLLELMSNNNFKKVSNNYDKEFYLKKLEEAYESLI